MVQWVKNPTAAARVAGRAQVQSPAQDSGLKDLVLLQLWLVADVAWIHYLAGELPYAMGAAIKKKKSNNGKQSHKWTLPIHCSKWSDTSEQRALRSQKRGSRSKQGALGGFHLTWSLLNNSPQI